MPDKIIDQTNNGAIISEDKNYRYQLWRIWDASKPLILWVMLNPSTADNIENDPTIKRCIGFTKSWNYGGMYVGNIFAFRSTNPKKLKEVYDPVGLYNYQNLKQMQHRCEKTICAWGNLPIYGVCDVLHRDKCFCLGINKNRSPKHPLYLKSDIQPVKFYYA